MKVFRKVYLLKVNVFIKLEEIWIDYFYFVKNNSLDFKIENRVFIILCWYDEYMLKKCVCV